MIQVKEVSKAFVQYNREKGLKGIIKSIFKPEKKIRKAVKNISFNIGEGEIIGYIGSNGAGKSTTIKMLTGILTPTEGDILIDGVNPNHKRKENAKNMGVVFGQRTNLWWDLPLRESFLILKEIYNVRQEDYEERMAYFNELFEIDAFMNAPVRTLSLGQRMRADIVASLLHMPKILYLDEPTIGLDVVAKHKIRKAIKELNQKFKTTIILTTHDLDDIEALCERVIMIDKGKMVFDGPLATIRDIYGTKKSIKFQAKDTQTLCKFHFDTYMEQHLKYKINENVLEVWVDISEINVSEVVKCVIGSLEIEDMIINDTPIEEIIGKIYNEGFNNGNNKKIV